MIKPSKFISLPLLDESVNLPDKFTFPFNYQPHPLSLIAANELKKYLTQQNWDHNFGFDNDSEGKVMGKMFGVLVVQAKDGSIGYLSAFSGKLANRNNHPLFVPPIFDRLDEEGFFRIGEEELNTINSKISELETGEKLKAAQANLLNLKAESEKELQLIRAFNKEQKSLRKTRRKLSNTLPPNEAEELLKKLSQESQDQDRHYKRLLKKQSELIHHKQEKVNALLQEIEELKLLRKQKSASIQQQLFDQYHFLNAQHESKSLLSIFEETKGTIPPAGAGDCAAPKLLHYAYANQLHPLCIAEFWWGASPRKEIRKHGEFYPACRSKCEPILGHMLKGLQVEPNPISELTFQNKKIDIIFEDDYLVLLHKPHDLLSVPGKTEQDSVATRMQARYPNAQGPMIVHRLDLATSGLLLVSKTPESYKLLQQQFAHHTIKKRYVALLDGIIEANEGTINLPLRVDLDNRPYQLVCYDYGKEAITKYKVIERRDNKTRVHFYPVTGRTHQLRVHASHPDGLNTPILGDDLYGTPSDRLYLHAESLSFIHPIFNTPLEFTLKADF